MKKQIIVISALLLISNCLAMQQEQASHTSSASERVQERQPLMVHVPYRATPDETCGICLEKPKPPIVLLPCGHLFCESCINTWRLTQGERASCPLCRAHVPPVGGIGSG